jgi:hypothetical protein
LAGIDDCGPFPTFLRFEIAPPWIKRFALKNGLSIEYFREYESQRQRTFREKHKVVEAIFWLLGLTIKALSLGKIDALLTDCMIVLNNPKKGSLKSPKTV